MGGGDMTYYRPPFHIFGRTCPPVPRGIYAPEQYKNWDRKEQNKKLRLHRQNSKKLYNTILHLANMQRKTSC